MLKTIRSCCGSHRLVGSSAAILIAAMVAAIPAGHATGETGSAARQAAAPTAPIRDGIFSSIRLMFTGTYRYSPPQPIDPAQFQRRILPPEMQELARLPVEKAAYIPHKLDFHVAPNALTVQPQAQPSIAHIVPRGNKLKTATGRRAPDANVTAALTRSVAQPMPTSMPISRNSVSAIAATEAALDESRLARERRYALLVVDRDIAIATELTRRFVLHTAARPVVQPGLLDLPETLAPSDETVEVASKTITPASVDAVAKAGTVALPVPNPRRSSIASQPKRRKSRYRARRTPRPKRHRPIPVAPTVFGGAEYGPKWAQSFLSAH